MNKKQSRLYLLMSLLFMMVPSVVFIVTAKELLEGNFQVIRSQGYIILVSMLFVSYLLFRLCKTEKVKFIHIILLIPVQLSVNNLILLYLFGIKDDFERCGMLFVMSLILVYLSEKIQV